MAENKLPVVVRADGVTAAERNLSRLCDRSFLSLWSYTGVYRDQGRNGKGDGKELCDLLVVFEDHVIIFSDKECEFRDIDNVELTWRRWYRTAIEKSASQIWGAERWIRDYPNRLYLGRECTQPFPLHLPAPDRMKIHRVAVAHGAAQACQKLLGGSGSFMIDPEVTGPDQAFTIGQIDPSKGFIHVLNDTSLGIVLGALDTISDFVSYLTKKEQLIQDNRLGWAASEEDLLAFYLKRINNEDQHDFVIPTEYQFVSVAEGVWAEFASHRQRSAQLSANRISYMWDALIETFAKHILGGTSHFHSHTAIADRERILRFLAREGRTRRRLLAQALLGIMTDTPADKRGARVVLPSYPEDPHYVFLLFPKKGISNEEYRELRRDYLQAYCMVTKLRCPEAQSVIGIATEAGLAELRSEDALYLDVTSWSDELNEQAQQLQEKLGILVEVKEFRSVEKEYPDWRDQVQTKSGERVKASPLESRNIPRKVRASKAYKNKIGRGAPCPCMSGKLYRKCCARKPQSANSATAN